MPRAVPWVEVAAFAAATVGLMRLLFAPFHLGLFEVSSLGFGVSGWILPVLLIGALALAGALPGRWREPAWDVSEP